MTGECGSRSVPATSSASITPCSRSGEGASSGGAGDEHGRPLGASSGGAGDEHGRPLGETSL